MLYIQNLYNIVYQLSLNLFKKVHTLECHQVDCFCRTPVGVLIVLLSSLCPSPLWCLVSHAWYLKLSISLFLQQIVYKL